MRVVAYNIKEFEKELLAKANAKVHDLTFISNPLNLCTIRYAEGKEAVIVSTNDLVDQQVLSKLSSLGVKKIITRSSSMFHIDVKFAKSVGIQVAHVLDHEDGGASVAEQTISNLNSDFPPTSACYEVTSSQLGKK